MYFKGWEGSDVAGGGIACFKGALAASVTEGLHCMLAAYQPFMYTVDADPDPAAAAAAVGAGLCIQELHCGALAAAARARWRQPD